MHVVIQDDEHMKISDTVWYFLAEAASQYFRVDVKGRKYLPKNGSGIVIPNHSGFSGTDGVILSHTIHKYSDRIPIILAHRTFFDLSQKVKSFAERFGLRKATYQNGLRALKNNEILMLFPEGELGNFKSSLQSYHIQPFHTGFVRMAIETKAPIIPCLVIGAEESHLNVGNIDMTKYVKDLHIPLPLNLLPLPAKWTIHFLKPIHLKGFTRKDLKNKAKMEQIAQRIRRQMQVALGREVQKRPYVYFPFAKWLEKLSHKSH